MLFRTKLMCLLFLLALLPTTVMGTLLFPYTINMIRDNSLEKTEMIIRSNSKNLYSVFDDVSQLMVEIMGNMETYNYLGLDQKADENQFIDAYMSLYWILGTAKMSKSDYIRNFHIFPSGDLQGLSSYVGWSTTQFRSEYEQTQSYKRAVESRGNIIWSCESIRSEAFSSKEKDSPIVILASAAAINYSKLKTEGILCAQINMSQLQSDFLDMFSSESDEAFMLLPDDTIVCATDPREIGLRYKNDLVLGALDKDGETATTIKMKDGYYHVFCTTSDRGGFRIIVCHSDSRYRERIQSAIELFVLMLGLVLLITIIASRYLSVSISRPVTNIMNAMNKIGEENLDVRVSVDRNDEFGCIGKQLNAMADRIKLLLAQVEDEQNRKNEADMLALRVQIMPHFLYNTLNVVKCLAKTGDMDGVQGVTTGLAHLLKTCFETSDTTTIESELFFLKKYDKIQKYRLDIDYEIVYNVDHEIYNCMIKKLTLQPLVENCLIHGFVANSGNIIEIAGRREGDKAILFVRDNGVGIGNKAADTLYSVPSSMRFNSIGINNVNDRIKLSFGQIYGVTLRNRPQGGTEATIVLPFQEFEEE